jgi:hypothetical protein
MINYLIIAALVLLIVCVKMILDLNTLVLKVKKDRSIRDHKNPLDKTYQFIKGLY